jgi:hypothetical protein
MLMEEYVNWLNAAKSRTLGCHLHTCATGEVTGVHLTVHARDDAPSPHL